MNKRFFRLMSLLSLLLVVNASVAKDDDGVYQKAYEGKSKAYIRASENYADYLETTISENWEPAKVKGNLEAAVYFEIDKNGFINNIQVTKSNAPKVFQDSCVRTITKLAPFRKLPEELGDKYYFEFTFKQKRDWK